jgi:ribosome-associated translation inhibitor RaiA
VELDIRGLRRATTPVFRRYVERRLRHVLRSFSKRVVRVTVRLIQDQGRGRRGIRGCQVTVSGRGFESLRIEERHGSIYAAFRRATGQTKRAVARAIHRGRRFSHPRWGSGLARRHVTASPEAPRPSGPLTSTLPT